MASLTRDQVLALRAALPRRAVDVTDYGSVQIRTLTLKEVGAIQKKQRESFANEPLKLYPELLLIACVDDDGDPLFDKADGGAIEALPWPVVDELARAIMVFSHMIEEEGGPKAAPPSPERNGSGSG